jgi:poly(3-hydroxybutyrate) depolymerase
MLNFCNVQQRFWQMVLKSYTTEQGWRLDNDIVLEQDQLVLRRFNKADSTEPAILIVPPNAGHHSNIAERLLETYVNLMPERNIYAIEWLQAKGYEYSLDDMIREIDASVQAAGGVVHIIGLCQGAWASAIYAALYPDNIVSYTNAAGPIDFAAGDGKIKQGCEIMPFSFFKNMVLCSGGVQKGTSQVIGFKSLNFYDRYVGDYVDLWTAICAGDETQIERWERFKGWYEHTVDLNGEWYLEAVEKLFKGNQLINGKLEILGERVNLGNITCPVFLLAGENDDITLPDQLFNMEKYVSGSVTKYIVKDAGHIGVFIKTSALEYWKIILNMQKGMAQEAAA